MLRRNVLTALGKLLMMLCIPVRGGYGNILVGPEASVRVVVGTELMYRKE
jgi:hypothetical protein